LAFFVALHTKEMRLKERDEALELNHISCTLLSQQISLRSEKTTKK
jgi:hypothetical protein